QPEVPARLPLLAVDLRWDGLAAGAPEEELDGRAGGALDVGHPDLVEVLLPDGHLGQVAQGLGEPVAAADDGRDLEAAVVGLLMAIEHPEAGVDRRPVDDDVGEAGVEGRAAVDDDLAVEL